MHPSDPDPWPQVKQLFGRAVELDPDARRAFLDRETEGAPDLRRRVEDLLAADEAAGPFLEEGASGGLNPDPVAGGGWVGRRFGAYEVIGELGRGGTGVVLLAARADGRYDSRVALKVVPAALVQGQLRERFRAEIRILAELDHPHIARLLDAGETPEGLAYLVMELVDGPRIDVFADQRFLDLRARLELFQSVLDGVRYAHAHGVIHRDFKPSNILVTSKGVPKLVDFGIAKLLGVGDGGGLTQLSMRMMTPEYASPEQARGAAVDARSDIYSLGVVLYRLLTGRAPYALDPTEPRAAERVICEQPPTRPSAAVTTESSTETEADTDPTSPALTASQRCTTPGRLSRALRGDLDAIVLQALAKDPAHRYQSVPEFEADVGRFLEGRPVQARNPGPAQRTVRFVARHRMASVIVAVGLAVASALGWQAREARIQRRAAEASSAELTRLVSSVLTTLNTDVSGEDHGPTARRVAAVEAAVASLQDLTERVPGHPTPELLSALARVYQEVGTLQGHPLSPNIGDVEAAKTSLQRSLDLWTSVVAQAPDPSEARMATVGVRVLLADIFRNAADRSKSFELLRTARGTVDSLSAELEPSLSLLQRRAMVYERLSWLADADGDLDQAASDVAELSEASAGMVALTPEGPGRLNALQGEVLTLQHHSYLRDKAAHFDEAIEIQQRAVRLADSLAALPGATQRTRSIHAEALAQLGWRFNDADRPDEAETAFTHALAISAAIRREDPRNRAAVSSHASYLEGRGQARIRGERWSAAIADHREAVALLEPLRTGLPVADFYLVQTHRELGESLTRLGRYDEAEREYEESLDMAESLFRADTTNAFARKVLGLSYFSHALSYRLRAEATGDQSVCGPANEAEARGTEQWGWLREHGQTFPGEETIWSDFESMMPVGACLTD